MQGRQFLDVARRMLAVGTEAEWRAAAGRAYYAVMLEARELLAGWGIGPGPRANYHYFVQSRFNTGADPAVLQIGATLNRLAGLRTAADYDLSALPKFRSAAAAGDAVQKAEQAIQFLDALAKDAARKANLLTAIRAGFAP
jgi:uncharacterized protein (UPF0332 family)